MNIYFISKGIGTEVAGVVSGRLGYEKIRSIFLTPTNYAVKHIISSQCIVVAAAGDGIFTEDSMLNIQDHKKVQLFTIQDVNRCLEDDSSINRTLEILSQTVNTYTDFFTEKI